MGFDSRDFRSALGTFATGVTIVTTISRDGDPIGLTANSFSSVSLDPPLLLFCLARESYSFAHFEKCAHFVVNVLSSEQESISTHFAKPAIDKWRDVSFEMSEIGSPAFADALAIFECSTFDMHDAGDHVIVIGKVEAYTHKTDGQPLLYYRGKYAGIGQDA